jgi:hypothetical protein
MLAYDHPALSEVSYGHPRGGVLRTGWLEKKGGETFLDEVTQEIRKERNFSKGGRRNWKRRWFVLYADGELAYYADEPP